MILSAFVNRLRAGAV